MIDTNNNTNKGFNTNAYNAGNKANKAGFNGYNTKGKVKIKQAIKLITKQTIITITTY